MSSHEINQRLAIYIDGFNIYHAIDDLGNPKLKWLNLFALGKSLLRPGEELVLVHYFTAEVTWNIYKRMRQRAYTDALEATGVKVTWGNFKNNDKHCTQNNRHCPFNEEKQTDVSIGVHMVADAFREVFTRAILITADTDQIPTIEMIQRHLPDKLLTWVAPPGRMQQAREIGDLITDRSELTAGQIGTCRLPNMVLSPDKKTLICTCPAEYK